MSLSDPLGDMLTRIRNAQRARHSMCMSPASQLRANVLGVLKREGFIRGYSAEELRPGVARLKIELKYNEGEPVIKDITRVSRPGRRVYSKIKELPHVLENRDFQSGHLFLVLKEWNINIVVTLVRHHKNTIPPSKKESDILMQRSQRKPTTTYACSPQYRPASFWCFSKNSLTFSSTLSVHPSHGTNP